MALLQLSSQLGRTGSTPGTMLGRILPVLSGKPVALPVYAWKGRPLCAPPLPLIFQLPTIWLTTPLAEFTKGLPLPTGRSQLKLKRKVLGISKTEIDFSRLWESP